MKRLAAKLLVRSGLCRAITFPTNGFQLRFFPTCLSEDLWVDPTRRGWHTRFIRSILNAGDVCVDVGANIGSTVIPSSQSVGASGRVIAFEPNARICKFLTSNLRLNGCRNVAVHQVALGERVEERAFSNEREDDRSAISDRGNCIVRVAPLDDFTAHVARIALLKIDVEGFEREVLKGAKQTLAKSDCLHIEFARGYADVAETLRAAGFSLFLPSPRRLHPMLQFPTEHDFFDVIGFSNRQGRAAFEAREWEKRIAA